MITIVPIPLSPERLQERGFNQAEALIVEAGLQSANLLKRTHSEKQSKKSRSDRIHVPQVFSLEPTTLEGKRILLVDDIYTTGFYAQTCGKNISREWSSLCIIDYDRKRLKWESILYDRK